MVKRGAKPAERQKGEMKLSKLDARRREFFAYHASRIQDKIMSFSASQESDSVSVVILSIHFDQNVSSHSYVPFSRSSRAGAGGFS